MPPFLDADVAIVGAGPVGSVLACLLSRRGIRTLLLERGEFPRDKACGEGLMPGGVAVLDDLGIDLGRERYPMIRGIRYRTPDGRSAFGAFRPAAGSPGHGYGVRRVKFDQLLATRAGAAPAVQLETGCGVTAMLRSGGRLRLETDRGSALVNAVIGADGIRSRVRSLSGWTQPASRPHRYGLVSHLEVPGHGVDEVQVTLVEENEVYLAPSGPDELLAVVLGRHGTLRLPELSVAQTYARAVFAAHPQFAGASFAPVRGAGPFRVGARQVAKDGVFLVGDAAGFIDPLTGEAMSAGFRAAARLAELLALRRGSSAREYSNWFRRQWRTRRIVSSIAFGLISSPALTRRALSGIARRPAALEALLEVNSGVRTLGSVGLRNWSSLAGV